MMPPSTSSVPSSRKVPVSLLLLAALAAVLAVNSQSLWIDEAQTALKAIQPTLAGWWGALDKEHNSNMQMPVYMFYIWAWARVFGVSEIVLRAANIPWFLLGFLAIACSLRRHTRLRDAALLLYSVHPFIWYYLNEARPYSMQLAGALLVEGALWEALDDPPDALSPSWWWRLCGGIFFLCGSGLLGIPWALAIAIWLVFIPVVRRSLFPAGRSALAVMTPLLLALAVYFAWTMKEKISTGYLPMNAASVFSVFYEQLGFLGLGPDRNALRAHSLGAMPPYFVPIALLGIPLAFGLLIAASRRFGLSSGLLVKIVLLTASPVILIFTLGFARHARILGRHLTPLFPFILMAQVFAVLLLWSSGRRLGRLAAGLIVICLACSSLELRFSARHAKDDYRSAAAAAKSVLSQGKSVWWCASDDAADFYRVPLSRGVAEPGKVFWVYYPRSNMPVPDDIFLSKPDLSDPTGQIQAFIASHHYRPVGHWTAFTQWEKPSPGA